jgi:tetratricopeptide (TPR) repeat protein
MQAVAADPNYVYPYEQLFRLAFIQGDWPELAANTDRVMHLDPGGFPDAYYFNGVAHFQLRSWEAAEKSLVRAIEIAPRDAKAHYVLGLVLVGKHDLPAAAENLETFATMAPTDPQVPKARQVLSEIAKVLPPAATP